MLNKITADDFDEVYSILKNSFPTDEIRPYRLQKELFAKNEYKILGAIDEHSGEIKGLIAVYEFDTVLYIEHFAVNRKYRNQGLGTLMLKELIDSCDKKICLEVELPTTDLAKRRIDFYKRNGFYLNDYHYIQPPLAEGQKPLELRIMTLGKELSSAEFQQIKELLYKKVYSVQHS